MGISDSMDVSLSKLQEIVVCCSPWGLRVRLTWVTECQHIRGRPVQKSRTGREVKVKAWFS